LSDGLGFSAGASAVIRAEAEADLADILDYITIESSDATAAKYVGAILDHCDVLASLPTLGEPADDVMPGLRAAGFRKTTVIAYAVIGDRVNILAVFYGRRDWKARFQDR